MKIPCFHTKGVVERKPLPLTPLKVQMEPRHPAIEKEDHLPKRHYCVPY